MILTVFTGKNHVRIQSTVEWLIAGKHPLSPFASDDVVDATVTHQLPDLFPVSPTIDLTHEHIWKYENITGDRIMNYATSRKPVIARFLTDGVHVDAHRLIIFCWLFLSTVTSQPLGWRCIVMVLMSVCESIGLWGCALARVSR